METIKFIILVIVNVLGSNALAYLVTHSPRVVPVKPFNCYGCLAFWLTLLFGTLIAYGQSWHYMALIIAALSALLNYFYIKSKYQIYE